MHNLPTLYNPAEKDKEILIKEFVVRTKTFQGIFRDLKSSKMKRPEQHYLIVGQRGTGKTTLLHRLMYAVKDEKQLKNVSPILFNEEQYHISELANLWESIAFYLQENVDGFEDLLNQLEEHQDKEDYEDIVFKGLEKALIKEKRKVILLIDNFITLISKFSELEVKKLREVLMTCPEFRLIAASPILPDDVVDYQKPLMGFFKIVVLKSLDTEEIKILLKKLAVIYNEKEAIDKIIKQFPGRIEVLKRLTGGVIRTIVLLFKVFTDNEGGKSIKDLQMTLDAVTPLYKHRMDDLPKFQQKIVDAVAKNWDAISTKEIVAKTRIESKAVSAQMKQLEKNQIIEKEQTNTKNHLYRIKERFFNIWYLMRYGRKQDRQRVIWLVKFLEAWCDDSELNNRVKVHLENLLKGDYDYSAAIIMGQAYLSSEKVSSQLKYELVSASELSLPASFTSGLNLTDKELMETGLKYAESENFTKALEVIDKIKKKDVIIFSFIAVLYRLLSDFTNSLIYYKKAVKLENDEEEKGKLLFDIALIYDLKLSKLETAENYYFKAAELGMPKAMNNLAGILIDKGEFDKAEDHLRKCINLGYDRGLMGLGRLYEIKGNYQEAIDSYEEAYEKFKEAKILSHMADVYRLIGNQDKAEPTYRKAIQEGYEPAIIRLAIHLLIEHDKQEDAHLLLKEADLKKIKGRFRGWALYYHFIDDYKNAEKFYLKVIKEGNSKESFQLLAILNRDKNEFTKAEKYFNLSRKNGINVDSMQAEMYLNNNLTKKRSNALEYAKNSYNSENPKLEDTALLSLVLLWNNQIDEGAEVFLPLLENEEWLEENQSHATKFFVLLMANEQLHTAYQLFINSELDLKERLKPVYFALMQLMKEEFPNEHLKMGEELRKTVEEIIEEVQLYQNEG